MKKSLIAAAAMIITSAAYADSVTIYGLIDEGYISSSTIDNGKKTNENGIVANTSSTSRIGFKGQEDLGGGNKSNFVLEFGGNPNTGDGGQVRQAYVALSNDSFGKFGIGRQQTFTYDTIMATDASGISGLVGSISHNRIKDLDRANSVSYSIGNEYVGLNGAYSVSNASSSDQTGQASGGLHAYEVGANARYGMFSVNAGYTNAKVAGTGSSEPFGIRVSGALNAKTIYANAGYDFGILKANYSYYAPTVDAAVAVANASVTPFVKAQFHQLGLSTPITPSVDLFGNYLVAKVDSGVYGETGNGYQAGARYTLSKRTNIYAGYGKQQLGSYKESAYTVGLKHTF